MRPTAARTAALVVAAVVAAAAHPQTEESEPDLLLAAVADPAARQLLSHALNEIQSLRATVAALQHDGAAEREGSRRRRHLQRAGGDAGAARAVHIYTRSMQSEPQSAGRGRRRRAQGEVAPDGCWTAGGTADTIDVEGRTAEVHAACCTLPGDDCSSGMPSACSAACADVLMDYWADCAVHLRIDKATYVEVHQAVQACQEADVSRSGEALAMQLSLSCTDGVDVRECVPACSADLHGDLLLATIDGEDSKYSCELHHSRFSWVGAAADGGFLGRDALAFLSALLSGAAGVYICTLDEDASVSTTVVIQPGMTVHVSGDPGLPGPPTWGTGSWTVADRSMLSITYMQLHGGTIDVAAGGSLSLVDLALESRQIGWTEHAGATLSLARVSLSGTNFESGVACKLDEPPTGLVIRPSSRDLPIIGKGVIDYYDLYPYGDHCSWTIQCPGVHLEITDFATEQDADYLRLFADTADEIQLSGVMTMDGIGTQRSPTSCTAATNMLETKIAFIANVAFANRGFRIEWQCPDGALTTQSYTVAEDTHSHVDASPGALPWQCFEP